MNGILFNLPRDALGIVIAVLFTRSPMDWVTVSVFCYQGYGLETMLYSIKSILIPQAASRQDKYRININTDQQVLQLLLFELRRYTSIIALYFRQGQTVSVSGVWRLDFHYAGSITQEQGQAAMIRGVESESNVNCNNSSRVQ